MTKRCKIDAISARTLSLCDPAWKNVKRHVLNQTNFSPDKDCPRTVVRVVSSREGLTLRFDCAETEPAARYSGLHDPSWLDSCVEFFFAPDGDCADYLNFEQSAGGALLIQKGPGRAGRVNVGSDISAFEIERDLRKDGWSVKFFVPYAFVLTYFDKFDGHFRGNFQFCNEDKGLYMTWNRINTPEADYHRPEFFGVFETEV